MFNSFQPENDDALYDVFELVRNNFQEWLRVWKMDVSEGNANNRDLLAFAREKKAKFTDLVENEIKELKSVKVSFGLKAMFTIERNGEMVKWNIFEKKNRIFSTGMIKN